MPRPPGFGDTLPPTDYKTVYDRGEGRGFPDGTFQFETTDLAGGSQEGVPKIWAEFTCVATDKAGGDTTCLGRTMPHWFTMTEDRDGKSGGSFRFGQYLRALGITPEQVATWPTGQEFVPRSLLHMRFWARLGRNKKDPKYADIEEFVMPGTSTPAPVGTPPASAKPFAI